MDNGTLSSAVSEIAIVYDGQCPFCQQYTRLMRIRSSAGEVRLIDARSDDPLVAEVVRRGYDLDHGMVVSMDDNIYHGAEAMHVLAMLSTRAGWFNRFSYYIFRSKRIAAFLYPMLRAGRNLVLRLLGHKLINQVD